MDIIAAISTGPALSAIGIVRVHLVEQLRCVEVSAAVHQPDGLRVQIPGEGEGGQVRVGDVYDFNAGSRRLFTALGFRGFRRRRLPDTGSSCGCGMVSMGITFSFLPIFNCFDYMHSCRGISLKMLLTISGRIYELYFIEALEADGWRPVGDVCLSPDDFAIVIGEKAYRGRGITGRNSPLPTPGRCRWRRGRGLWKWRQ